jgi:mono/diheme cytochrome c family protein
MPDRLQTWLRVLAWTGGTGIVLLLLALGVILVLSQRPINRVYDVAAPPVAVPTDSASIARGEHIGRAIAKCVDCHGNDLAGSIFYSSMPFGLFPAPNLTTGRGGIATGYGDADWVRAIRHGLHRDGRPLPWMPADAYIWMSDADLGALIAWIKAMPPQDRGWPEKPRYGPIARMLLATGAMPLFQAALVDHARTDVPVPSAGVTVEYGMYLARIGGCTSCHGMDLRGGIEAGPGSPPSANLTRAGLSGWSETDLFRVFREGKRPDGRELDDRYMPWRNSGRMTDDELRAIWTYLQSLPGTATPAGT